MLEKLKEMISGSEADYIDIRYELKRETSAAVAGPELKKAGSSTTDGYVVRALKNGGFSSVTVTAESDVPEAVKLAVQGASAMPAEAKQFHWPRRNPVLTMWSPTSRAIPPMCPFRKRYPF